MKLRGKNIWFRADWSGDASWVRRNRIWPDTAWNSTKCPYNIGHCITTPRFNSGLLFKKWVNRDNPAYRLYWRLHKKEWERMNACR